MWSRAHRLSLWFLCLGGLLAFQTYSAAQVSLESMRAELRDGYFNAAAEITGPKLIETLPNEAEAHYLYAYALYLTNQQERARASLNKAQTLHNGPNPATYDHLDGLLLAAAGEFTEALRALQSAYRKHPQYDTAMDWGVTAWQTADYEAALKAFAAASNLAEGQQHPWPWLNQGRLHHHLEQTDEAANAYKAAIDAYTQNDPGDGRPASPAYVEAYYRLGELYEASEDFQNAELNYKAALAADPNYEAALTALERISQQLNR